METQQSGPENNEQIFSAEELIGWQCIDNRTYSAANWLRSHSPSCSSASICVAYLSPSGFEAIEHELECFLNTGASLSIVSSEEITRVNAEFLLRLAALWSVLLAATTDVRGG